MCSSDLPKRKRNEVGFPKTFRVQQYLVACIAIGVDAHKILAGATDTGDADFRRIYGKGEKSPDRKSVV